MKPVSRDIRLVRSLQQKKFRREHQLFVVEGKKMVEEALHAAFTVHSVYSSDEAFIEAHPASFRVSAKEMEQMTSLTTPSAHLAVLEIPKEGKLQSGDPWILVLDGIADPGNMGTILRSAEWFGIRQVLCTDDCVELYNPKVIQSTMGSIFRMKVITAAVPACIDLLRDHHFHLYGADMQGENLYTAALKTPAALIIGSESHGIRPHFQTVLHQRITIPGSGHAESLNAAIACSVILSDIARRKA